MVCSHCNTNTATEKSPAGETEDHRTMLVYSAVCGIAGLGGFILTSADGSLGLRAAALFFVSYIAGGWFAARDVSEELRRKTIDVHFLMLLVAFGAVFTDSVVEGAALLFLFSLSGGLEAFARNRTDKAISSLYRDYPKVAMRRSDGGWIEIPIESVGVDDVLLVRPGELFPTDGVLVEGDTSVDESALTGESIPVAKSIGSKVFGGTLNQHGQAVFRVVGLPGQSAVQRVIKLIEDVQKHKAPAQRFTDLVSRYYTWFVLFFSASVWIYFQFYAGLTFGAAFYRTMVVLVVASPCALVISIPSAVLAAIASGARRGILFRGGMAVETLALVDTIAIDKTGTLTTGNLAVERVMAGPGFSEDKVLQYAASLEQVSTHPLARSITAEAARRGLPVIQPENVENVPGLGISATLEGRPIVVGDREFVAKRTGYEMAGGIDSRYAVVAVSHPDASGTILLSDRIRPDSQTTIEHMRELGLEVVLLSGDKSTAVETVAQQTGIKSVHKGLSPEGKLQILEQMQKAGHRVAMTGDGINDTPSLAAADVAVVMGDRASDSALELADIVLMGGRLSGLEGAVELSRMARRIIVQNLFISLSVVLVLVVNALFQTISLTVGVIGHEGSTVVVVLNSLRLLNAFHQRPLPVEPAAVRAAMPDSKAEAAA